MVTIKDVAEKAGLNVSTVSRVLNNKGYISEKTRETVYRVVEELNYQPNEVARSLLKRKSNLLGFIIPNVAHPFYGQLASYIEYFAHKKGYKVMVCNSHGDYAKENDYINMLKRNQVDGIIMGGHAMETSKYENLGRPIVTIDRNISENIPNISSDHYTGGLMATNLLIEKGCKKLGHVRGPMMPHYSAFKRTEAFEDLVKEKNIDHVIYVTESNYMSIDEYVNDIYKLFQEHPDIDGMFANSDLVAAAVMKVANKLGLVIPRDIKVVGYDDVLIPSLLTQELTSVRQPVKKIAELAVQVVLEEFEGEAIKSETILPVELIERETT